MTEQSEIMSPLEKLRYRLSSMATSGEVILDVAEAIRGRRFWIELAVNDIRGRYRRTVLGPWWLVIGNGLALGAMAFVWSVIFRMQLREFFPYLVSGFIVWMMIASYLTEGCQVFTAGSAASIQKNIPLPKTIHAFRLVTRSAFLFFHNFVFFILVALFTDVSFSGWTLLAIPGFILVMLNGVWISICMGIIGARYRDVEPLAGAMMTFIFLVTPIMWNVEMLGGRGFIASYNPVAHLIEIVRSPLLGGPPHPISWLVCSLMFLIGSLAAFVLLRHSKHRLIYWL
ncbi:ABC transporter permease [Ferrovibrio terrae]|uniref:ABC transporter permease n=1 Tax=Ferrovibrio terrae TaxID=2594003 RepID=UPI003137BD26